MHCLRCGRELKDAKSRDREYGPKCWKKVKEDPDLLYFSKHKEIQDELVVDGETT